MQMWLVSNWFLLLPSIFHSSQNPMWHTNSEKHRIRIQWKVIPVLCIVWRVKKIHINVHTQTIKYIFAHSHWMMHSIFNLVCIYPRSGMQAIYPECGTQGTKRSRAWRHDRGCVGGGSTMVLKIFPCTDPTVLSCVSTCTVAHPRIWCTRMRGPHITWHWSKCAIEIHSDASHIYRHAPVCNGCELAACIDIQPNPGIPSKRKVHLCCLHVHPSAVCVCMYVFFPLQFHHFYVFATWNAIWSKGGHHCIQVIWYWLPNVVTIPPPRPTKLNVMIHVVGMQIPPPIVHKDLSPTYTRRPMVGRSSNDTAVPT